MSKSGTRKSLKTRIAKFRLTAASAILGNLAHVAPLTSDMQGICHIAELCEQYSLLIALNWLGTKYGFPVCSQSIEKDLRFELLPLLSWTSLVDRYPLQVHDDLPFLGRVSEELRSFMDQSFEPELELIGEIYQQTLAAPLAIKNDRIPYIDLKSDARLSGEFYTPAWVADYAFEQWLNADSANLLQRLKADDARLLPTILDPSCGSGNFLLAAARCANRLVMSPQERMRFLCRSIHGKDIDGRAIELAKLSLLLSMSESISAMEAGQRDTEITKIISCLDQNIVVSDSLLLSCNAESKRHFDLVITNPPYISYGSRDQQRIGSAWQNYLKKRFPASSEYKIRYTSIFQEIGLELTQPAQDTKVSDTLLSSLSTQDALLARAQCAPTGLEPGSAGGSPASSYSLKQLPDEAILGNTPGQCIFLVPDAFLTGSYYQKLRNLIISKAQIVGLTELEESIIGDVTVGRWCLAHYKQVQGQTKNRDNQIILRSLSDGGAGVMEFLMPFAALVSKDRQRFQLLFSEFDLEIMLHCKEMGSLGEELRGRTGIRARNGQHSIVESERVSQNHQPGIISGSELRQFDLQWSGNWIEVVKEKLFAGGFDPAIIAGPKILVRQTGDSLVAAVDLSGLYHLNNVHSFVPLSAELRDQRLYFYTSLLNSDFYLYFYRLKTREHKRALAQIDIETVEQMPLPAAKLRSQKIELELESIAKTLSQCPCPDRDAKLIRMNDLIFDLFGLSQQMRKHIRASLSALMPVSDGALCSPSFRS